MNARALTVLSTTVVMSVLGTRSFMPSAAQIAPSLVEAPAPLLAPPDPAAYTAIDLSRPIESDNPLAVLSPAPDWTTQASLSLPKLSPQRPPAMVEYIVHSAIKYSGEQSSLLLSLSEPSPQTAMRGVAIGERRVDASTGDVYWIRKLNPGSNTTVIQFVRSGYIISLAGDIDESQTSDLIDRVNLIIPPNDQ